jgi:regulator of replication initiation timing
MIKTIFREIWQFQEQLDEELLYINHLKERLNRAIKDNNRLDKFSYRGFIKLANIRIDKLKKKIEKLEIE